LRAASLLLYLAASGLSTVARGLFITVPGCVWPLYCCTRPLYTVLAARGPFYLYLAASGLSTVARSLFAVSRGLPAASCGLFARQIVEVDSVVILHLEADFSSQTPEAKNLKVGTMLPMEKVYLPYSSQMFTVTGFSDQEPGLKIEKGKKSGWRKFKC
jgi:hypothetical protein